MNRFFYFRAFVGACAVGWGVTLFQESTALPDIDPMTTASIETGVYRLRATETGASCRITRGAARMDGTYSVEVEPVCASVMSRMRDAKQWRARSDGLLEINADDGDVIALFSEADGIDYESIVPQAPLLSLAAAR